MSRVYSCKRDVINGRVFVEHGNRKKDVSKRTTRWQETVTWMADFIDTFGQFLPHKDEVTVPFPSLKEAHAEYKADMVTIGQLPFKYDRFRVVWRTYYRHVKPKVDNGFAKCKKCIDFNAELEQTRSPILRAEIKARRSKHLGIVEFERRTYYSHRTLSRKYPDKYLSMIIDAMVRTV
jgi:hypothetical protein